MTVTVATLGFPRIGPRRELKVALERFWSGKSDRAALLSTAAELRARTWARQAGLGVDHVPSNDFSLYDHVLDTSAMVGAVPAIYGWQGGPVGLDTYFAMARGAQGEAEHADCGHGCHHKAVDVPAAEMTKWFDTNYHYLVPEFSSGQAFALSSTKVVDEYLEAKAQGIATRPVLLGPVTFLKLGKSHTEGLHRHELLRALLPVYAEVLGRLAAAGAGWVQIDEPCLVLDLTAEDHALLAEAYAALAKAAPGIRLMLTTYFGALGDNLDAALALPVAGLHLDLVRAPGAARDRAGQGAAGAGAVARRRRRPQRLARRPRGPARPARAGGGERPGDRAGALLLAAAHADRPGAGDRARRRCPELAGLRRPEDRGAGDAGPRAERRPCRRGRAAARCLRRRRLAPDLAQDPRCGGQRAPGRG